MKGLQNVLAHMTIIFVGVFLTLFVLNIFNPAMQFLTSAVSQIALLAFCFSALSLAVVTIMENRYRAELAHRRELDALRTRQADSVIGRPVRRD